MKAQELRIGNYVKDNEGILLINGFKPFEHSVRCDEDEGCVLLIDIIKNGNIDKGYQCDLDSVKPIPLTEEILLKCGFEKGLKYFSYKDFDIDLKGWFGFNNMVANADIKHLHQLQNLYFALTNEELEINL